MIEVALVLGAALLPALLTLAHKLMAVKQLGAGVWGPDAYWHLVYADALRRGEVTEPRYLLDPCYGYPRGFHWLLSFLSRERLERWQTYVPVVVKCVMVWMVAGTTGALALQLHPEQVDAAGAAAVLAGALYGLSPYNRSTWWWNCSDFQLSPRSFGGLLASLTCGVVVAADVTGSWALIGAALLLGSACCVTSKFAVQTLVFVLPVYALLSGSGWIAALPLGAIVLALVLSRGFYARVLSVQVRHLAQYARRIRREQPNVRSALASLDLLRLPWLVLRGRFREAWRDVVERDLLIRPLVLYPLHGVCGLLLLRAEVWSQPWLRGLAILWLATAVVVVVVSLPWFQFVGEADRYFEFVGFLPATALPVLMLEHLPLGPLGVAAAVAVLLGGFQVLNEFALRHSGRVPPGRPALWEALRSLAEATPEARLVCVPVQVANEVLYRTGLPVSFMAGWSPAVYDEVMLRYPIVRLDWSFWAERYRATHVLVSAGCLEEPEVAAAVAPLAVVAGGDGWTLRAIAASGPDA